jgi:uncharacterized membrane protein
MTFLTWLHLVAAVAWIGGMLFLSLALVPGLKQETFAAVRGALIRSVALRFRFVVWSAVVVLLVTGPLLLSQKVASPWDPSAWPTILTIKLALVAVLLGLTAVHDFWVGPKVAQMLREGGAGKNAGRAWLIQASPWLARVGLVLALAVLYAAVELARL